MLNQSPTVIRGERINGIAVMSHMYFDHSSYMTYFEGELVQLVLSITYEIACCVVACLVTGVQTQSLSHLHLLHCKPR
jgi:hypothetical protein